MAENYRSVSASLDLAIAERQRLAKRLKNIEKAANRLIDVLEGNDTMSEAEAMAYGMLCKVLAEKE